MKDSVDGESFCGFFEIDTVLPSTIAIESPVRTADDAEPIGMQTHAIARRLLELLPNDTPLPVISPEPDGQINFEWYRGSRRLLTTSISGTGTLYWAALIDSEDPRGSCQLADQFPPTLLYWIGMVCG